MIKSHVLYRLSYGLVRTFNSLKALSFSSLPLTLARKCAHIGSNRREKKAKPGKFAY